MRGGFGSSASSAPSSSSRVASAPSASPCQAPVLRPGGSRRERPPQGAGQDEAVISPLALEAVRRIDALFEIERAINGESAQRRRAVRQELSAPLLAWRSAEAADLPFDAWTR
jgi:hypothetical protein